MYNTFKHVNIILITVFPIFNNQDIKNMTHYDKNVLSTGILDQTENHLIAFYKFHQANQWLQFYGGLIYKHYSNYYQ